MNLFSIIKYGIKRRILFANLAREGVVFLGNKKFIEVISCDFEGMNLIRSDVKLQNVSMGYGSYIAEGSQYYNTTIGRYTCIGPYSSIIEGQHPTRDFVSIHPAFFSTKKQSGFTYVSEDKFEEHRYADEEKKMWLKIGNDVWIGAHALLLEGITIGDGAIIAAGSVVTHNVQPYEIVAGNPAKRIRMRFEEEDIKYLQGIRWWDNPTPMIHKMADFFRNINTFRDNMID